MRFTRLHYGRERLIVLCTVVLSSCLFRCAVQPAANGGGPSADGGGNVDGNSDGTVEDQEGNANDNTGGNDAGGGTDTGGMDDGAGQDATASGTYEPEAGLHLEGTNITLEIPAGALPATTEITLTPVTNLMLPAVIPGATGLAGAEFGPEGLVFATPVDVTARLSQPTIATQLPVITFDSTNQRWVGTGATGTVSDNGLDVAFQLEHFSTGGIPDGTPIPDPGDPIESILALSNNGSFQSDEISSESASMLYSDFGSTFSISLFSQKVNMQGQIVTKSLGLSSILVTRVDNYIVGVVGGENSLFNGGSFNEPAIGAMIMSLVGGQVSMSVYVATPDRVIHGTLIGTP